MPGASSRGPEGAKGGTHGWTEASPQQLGVPLGKGGYHQEISSAGRARRSSYPESLRFKCLAYCAAPADFCCPSKVRKQHRRLPEVCGRSVNMARKLSTAVYSD